jgi:hypothetical protein
MFAVVEEVKPWACLTAGSWAGRNLSQVSVTRFQAGSRARSAQLLRHFFTASCHLFSDNYVSNEVIVKDLTLQQSGRF